MSKYKVSFTFTVAAKGSKMIGKRGSLVADSGKNLVALFEQSPEEVRQFFHADLQKDITNPIVLFEITSIELLQSPPF